MGTEFQLGVFTETSGGHEREREETTPILKHLFSALSELVAVWEAGSSWLQYLETIIM